MTQQRPTYHQIASDFALWQEYFDIYGVDTQEAFSQRHLEEKLRELAEAFGPESAEEEG